MKPQTAIALAAAVLLCGATAASAEVASSHSGAAKPDSMLSLTMHAAKESVERHEQRVRAERAVGF